MRPSALALPLVLALAPAALSAAPRGPWAGFKAGSFVKTKTVTVVMLGAHKVETVTVITQTLVEVKGDQGVLETTATMTGVPRPTRTRSQVSLKDPLPAPVDPRRRSGKSSLAVAGRVLRCEWTEFKIDMAGSPTVVMTWTSPEVPGGVAMTYSRNELMRSTMEVVAFEAR